MQMKISLDDDDVEINFHIVAYSPLGTISWLWKTINIAKRRYICHAVTSAITLVNNNENRDYLERVLEIRIDKKEGVNN